MSNLHRRSKLRLSSTTGAAAKLWSEIMSSLSIPSLPLKLHIQTSSKPSLLPPLSRFQTSHPLKYGAPTQNPSLTRRHNWACFCSGSDDSDKKENGNDWPILRRWDVPWKWQAFSLTSVACGLSFVFTGLIESAALPYLGIRVEDLNLDGKAELLFVDQAIATAAVLAVLFGVTTSLGPLPDDVYRYDWRKPFDLQKGWLLWAGVGFGGALIAVAITGAAVSFFSGEMPERETDALVRLLPLIGSSGISTACLVGITGVLAPILEETVFRGFLMVFLTKWVPTPTAIIISAAVFALAHLTPGEIPQLFVLGSALGLSYAQTRNLLTPITIHSLWNSGVILLLTFLQLQGYDIKEIVQGS